MTTRLALFQFISTFLLLVAHSITTFAYDVKPLTKGESGIILSIHGSNTLGAKLVPMWAKNYLKALGLNNVQIEETANANEYNVLGEKGEQAYSIHIQAHGSSTGFSALKSNSAEVAMSSRAIKQKEIVSLERLGDMRSLRAENVVAIDGIAIIVHPLNPITSLSIDDIAGIFSGKIRNWVQVGGQDKKITRYARDTNSGTWDTFNGLVLKKHLKLDKSTERFESNDTLSNMVALDESSIGFVGLASVRNTKPLSISDGITTPLPPVQLHIATEDYPLSRRLYLYIPPDTHTERAEDFIDFTQATENQDTVRDVGYISLNPVTQQIENLQGPSAYLKLVEPAKRLSINFRFKAGSSLLDNRSQRDIMRIAAYIRSPENRSKYIQLIGFGDPKQTELRSIILSKLRATAVQSALYKKNIPTLPVEGFGAYMPVASQNGTRHTKNQRVEVWIFDSKHDQEKTIDSRIGKN